MGSAVLTKGARWLLQWLDFSFYPSGLPLLVGRKSCACSTKSRRHATVVRPGPSCSLLLFKLLIFRLPSENMQNLKRKTHVSSIFSASRFLQLIDPPVYTRLFPDNGGLYRRLHIVIRKESVVKTHMFSAAQIAARPRPQVRNRSNLGARDVGTWMGRGELDEMLERQMCGWGLAAGMSRLL